MKKTIFQIPVKVGGLLTVSIQDASLKALKRINIHTITHVFMYHSNRVLTLQRMNNTSPTILLYRILTQDIFRFHMQVRYDAS